MIAKLAGYLIAFICLAAIELPFLPVTRLSIALTRRVGRCARRWLSPTVTMILDVVKITSAIILAVWLVQKTGAEPGWLMFILPGVSMCRNDRYRVWRAKRGQSEVKQMMDELGQGTEYDHNLDIRIEKAHLAGDILGWIIGTNLCLQHATFF